MTFDEWSSTEILQARTGRLQRLATSFRPGACVLQYYQKFITFGMLLLIHEVLLNSLQNIAVHFLKGFLANFFVFKADITLAVS